MKGKAKKVDAKVLVSEFNALAPMVLLRHPSGYINEQFTALLKTLPNIVKLQLGPTRKAAILANIRKFKTAFSSSTTSDVTPLFNDFGKFLPLTRTDEQVFEALVQTLRGAVMATPSPTPAFRALIESHTGSGTFVAAQLDPAKNLKQYNMAVRVGQYREIRLANSRAARMLQPQIETLFKLKLAGNMHALIFEPFSASHVRLDLLGVSSFFHFKSRTLTIICILSFSRIA